jgi:Neuraminidase (sialidase)
VSDFKWLKDVPQTTSKDKVNNFKWIKITENTDYETIPKEPVLVKCLGVGGFYIDVVATFVHKKGENYGYWETLLGLFEFNDVHYAEIPPLINE